MSKGAKVEKKDPSLQKDHIKTSISPSFSPSKAPLLYLDTKGGVLTEAGEETANSSLEGNKDITFISEFKGLFFKYPLLSISLAVSLFSMAGIPPLIGFFSKQLVLYSALQNGYYFISVLAIIVSVISCSYYLQIVKLLFTPAPASLDGSFITTPATPLREGANSPLFSDPRLGEIAEEPKSNAREKLILIRKTDSFYKGASPLGVGASPLGVGATPLGEGEKPSEASGKINLTNTHSYLISTLTFTILFFFIKPSLILNSTQLLSLSLFYI